MIASIPVRTYASPDFLPFVGHFSPCGAKKTYKRRKAPHATVRPELVEGQAAITFA
jgi:hypothetical protein